MCGVPVAQRTPLPRAAGCRHDFLCHQARELRFGRGSQLDIESLLDNATGRKTADGDDGLDLVAEHAGMAEIMHQCPLERRRGLAVWPDLMHQAWRTAGTGWAPLRRAAVARIVRGRRSYRRVWNAFSMRRGPVCAASEAEGSDGGGGLRSLGLSTLSAPRRAQAQNFPLRYDCPFHKFHSIIRHGHKMALIGSVPVARPVPQHSSSGLAPR